MRLTRLHVDNFKSLVAFSLPLDQFTCLIGLNGSGKSTVLQAVDFASQLFKGQVSRWLEQRQWKAADLNSKLIRKSNIDLTMTLSVAGSRFRWHGSFNRPLLRCTRERGEIDGKVVFSVDDGHYWFDETARSGGSPVAPEPVRIAFEYEGSVLSQLKEELLPEVLLPFRTFLRKTASLDLLAPQFLRKRADKSQGEIGLGGERLSAFLHELSSKQKTALREQLKACYPQLDGFQTRSLRAGWKELWIHEHFANKWLLTEARHINDGMLRLMAILAEILTDNQFLLFDEIENGVNPELVEFLIDVLVTAKQQVLVTTHSPMILNYLNDDVARKGVQYLYKTPEGFTRSVPFFSIPSLAAKLEVMGPGEAFVDTELSQLSDEIKTMAAADEEKRRADPH